MKSPIRDNSKKNNTAAFIKSMLPRGSVINSHLFYSGQVALNLSSPSVFVRAHAASSHVYYFWRCLSYDPRRLYEMVTSKQFKFDKPLFPFLQENWFTYKNPFLKAGIFFILNQCSTTGLISSGDLEPNNYNPVTFSHLRKFTFPENFHLETSEKQLLELIPSLPAEEYHFVPAGVFNYNLFEYGKNQCAELPQIHHRNLAKLMSERTAKIIVSYDYHPGVPKIFKGLNIYLINKYGIETRDPDMAEEIVVANF